MVAVDEAADILVDGVWRNFFGETVFGSRGEAVGRGVVYGWFGRAFVVDGVEPAFVGLDPPHFVSVFFYESVVRCSGDLFAPLSEACALIELGEINIRSPVGAVVSHL